MNNPKISVLMSAYKPSRVGLFRTINSVLSQSFSDFEFLIVKDDEDENTLSLLKEIEELDSRVIIIDNVKNVGLVKSLNNGLRVAKGDYIARIDVDDWWENSKLEIQYNIMIKENLFVSGTDSNFVDEDLNLLRVIKLPSTDLDVKNHLILGRNPFVHSSVMFKRVEKMFYNENAIHTEDFEFWCRYSFLGKMRNIDMVLTNYIVDMGSITNSKRYLMYINATKVYFQYLKELKDNNLDVSQCIDEFKLIPIVKMNFFDKLFSKLYSKSFFYAIKDKKLLSKLMLISSLFVNYKVVFLFLKRKISYLCFKIFSNKFC